MITKKKIYIYMCVYINNKKDFRWRLRCTQLPHPGLEFKERKHFNNFRCKTQRVSCWIRIMTWKWVKATWLLFCRSDTLSTWPRASLCKADSSFSTLRWIRPSSIFSSAMWATNSLYKSWNTNQNYQKKHNCSVYSNDKIS